MLVTTRRTYAPGTRNPRYGPSLRYATRKASCASSSATALCRQGERKSDDRVVLAPVEGAKVHRAESVRRGSSARAFGLRAGQRSRACWSAVQCLVHGHNCPSHRGDNLLAPTLRRSETIIVLNTHRRAVCSLRRLGGRQAISEVNIWHRRSRPCGQRHVPGCRWGRFVPKLFANFLKLQIRRGVRHDRRP